MALPQRHPIRILRRQRRPIAAVLAGAAVLFAIQAARPTGGELVQVVVAARAIPAGATITESDLGLVAVPRVLVPQAPSFGGAMAPLEQTGGVDPPTAPDQEPMSQYLGQVSAVAVARGEQLHPLRLLSRDLAADPVKPDNRPMPLRLPDSTAANLLRPGNRIDVIAAAQLDPTGEATGGKVARVVARGVLVLSLLAEAEGLPGAGSSPGTLALVSVSEKEAVALSQAESEGRITFTVVA